MFVSCLYRWRQLSVQMGSGDNCLYRWAPPQLGACPPCPQPPYCSTPFSSHFFTQNCFRHRFKVQMALLRPGGFFWKIQNCPPLQRIVPLLQGFLPRLFSSTSGCIAWGHLSCTEKTFHKLLHPSCLRAFSQAVSFSSFLSLYCFLLSDVQGQKVSHIFAKKHSSINHLTAHCCFWPSIRGLLAHIFIHILII